VAVQVVASGCLHAARIAQTAFYRQRENQLMARVKRAENIPNCVRLYGRRSMKKKGKVKERLGYKVQDYKRCSAPLSMVSNNLEN